LILGTIPQKKIDQLLIGDVLLKSEIFKVFDHIIFDPYRDLGLKPFAVRIF